MAARRCKYCGKPLPANVTARCEYCPGGTCRKMAYKRRKATADPVRPGKQPEKREAASKPPPSIDRREFDRMMDGSMEDELRHVRDRLKTYVDDPDTPANAMPNIVAKYLAVCEKLHSLSGGDPLAGLLDEQEVGEDAGASVV